MGLARLDGVAYLFTRYSIVAFVATYVVAAQHERA